MNRKVIITALFLVFMICLGNTALAQNHPDTLLLFFLGGQSNMEGHGSNKDLPDSLRSTQQNVWIFNGKLVDDGEKGGGAGIWEPLRPGHGYGFKTDGSENSPGEKFGPELTFAHRLSQFHPGKKIALIKYAKGGASIDSAAANRFGCWQVHFHQKKGINQFDHFLNTMKNATSVHDINGDGTPDYLKPMGIVWMQGESDAAYEKPAQRYYDNLFETISHIRTALYDDSLPVVLGKISDSGWADDGKVWDYISDVHSAQERFTETDPNSALVRSTSAYKYSDPYHYDSSGYLDLGISFADAMQSLLEKRKTR